MQLIKMIREHEKESRKEWMMRMFEYAGRHNSNNRNFQFWRQDNHPILLKDAEMLSRAIEYVHNNPVVAGFTEDATAYLVCVTTMIAKTTPRVCPARGCRCPAEAPGTPAAAEN